MIRFTQIASKSIKPLKSCANFTKNIHAQPFLKPYNPNMVMFNPISRNITSIQKYKPGFLFYKLKKLFRARASLYKLLILTSMV
jgi:hypothetical protein